MTTVSHCKMALPAGQIEPEVDPALPRPEYPRPQFVRRHWQCLNGWWHFEMDNARSGLDRGLLTAEFTSRILVPFCPESSLSGVGNKDFMPSVWYRRQVQLAPDWPAGSRTVLHFGAVDYNATVWVRFPGEAAPREVARHRGGFTPFSCDLGRHLVAGDSFEITLRAIDRHDLPQPRGKQATRYAPHGCHYARTTGIWQTVWLESLPAVHFKRPRITPDWGRGSFHLELPLSANPVGWAVRASLLDAEGTVVAAETQAGSAMGPRLELVVPPNRRRDWSPENPHLYGVVLELLDESGRVQDHATSYCGLRSVALEGWQVRLNGKPVFQRLVLDQGYYPDGVMTAPTDEALALDIRLAQEAGFNGARLHQKVFEERFLYHADRLGYLVWGEFGDWGCAGFGTPQNHQQPDAAYITQWLEVLERDYSHPSIVGWCPLNETHQEMGSELTVLDDVTRGMFLATKAMDLSRPVLDTSGYAHRVPEADIYDSHDYIKSASFEEGLEEMRQRHAQMAAGHVYINYAEPGRAAHSIPYNGQPYFVSEFGGFKWLLENETEVPGKEGGAATWGYGSDPASLEEFYARFEAVCSLLKDNPCMFGYCYTQLTDIFPEQNGIFSFERRAKFDLNRLKAVQAKPAAIEVTGHGLG